MANTESAYFELLSMVDELNRLNDAYPRTAGSLIMVSDEVESEIENIVDHIDNQLKHLRDPDMLAEVSDCDQQLYLDNLTKIQEFLDQNRSEIARAREFLARYLSR